MPRDIYQVLKQDHKEISSMFKQLEKTYQQEVFTQLAEELKHHTKAEERVFYQPIKNQQQTHEDVLEGYEEHHVASLILRELETNKPGTDVWKAKLKVLKEAVEHHVQEEEGPLFEHAKTVIDNKTAKSMAEQFEQQKQQMQ